jgi:transcriptional adapter 2-alpha
MSSTNNRPRKKQKSDIDSSRGIDDKIISITNDDLTDLLEAETEPVQYHCDYCRKDISNSVRISCAVCPEFDLCLECFSVGVELRGHKNWHDYRVIDDMHFPFLSRDWSAEEEQLLLEGLELFGIGNWTDVSEHVSTKDKNACREHYEKYYLSSPTWPEPDFSHLLCTREKVKLLNSGKYNKIKRRDGIVVKKEITQKN